MTTAIYLRVSTDRQEHRSQLRSVLEWLCGDGVSWRECRWYRDRGESSAKLSRPAFDRMMVDADAGLFDRLVVYKMDRIGRWSLDDAMLWRLGMKRLGVAVVSVCGDATELAGLGDWIQELVRVEGDRTWLEGHRRRTADGIRARRRDGEAWGGARVVDPDRRGCAKLTADEWAGLAERVRGGERIKDVAADEQLNADYVSRKLGRLG